MTFEYIFAIISNVRGSGGTGRRARLRGVWFYRTGSIPVSRTNKKGTFVYQKFLFCLSIAKAMVYHHALACISSALTSISRQSEYLINHRLYRFRNDDIQCSALMIYRNKLRISYKACALIYLRKCDIIDSPINKNL